MVGCVAKISLLGLHSWMIRVSWGTLMGGHINLVLVVCVMLKLFGYLFSWWC